MKKFSCVAAAAGLVSAKRAYIAYDQGGLYDVAPAPNNIASAYASASGGGGIGGGLFEYPGARAYSGVQPIFEEVVAESVVDILPRPVIEARLPPRVARPIIQPIIQPLIQPVPVRPNAVGGRNQYKTIIINNESYNNQQTSNDDGTTGAVGDFVTTTSTTTATTTSTSFSTTTDPFDLGFASGLGTFDVSSGVTGTFSPLGATLGASSSANLTTPTIVFQPQFVFTTPNALTMNAASQSSGSMSFFQQQPDTAPTMMFPQQQQQQQTWWCGMGPCNGFTPNGFIPNGFMPNGFVPTGFTPNGFMPTNNGFTPNGYFQTFASYDGEEDVEGDDDFDQQQQLQGSLTISTQEIEFVDPTTGASMFLPSRSYTNLSAD